ncbi:MAG: hypothetical protein LUF01_07240 [Bacteroides sp.]|nr:hypothetical protein [Bacteroides sp.]
MKSSIYSFLLATFLLAGTACGSGNDSPDGGGGGGGGKELPGALDPAPVVKTNPMKLYAHYMPWFETPETSADKKWGSTGLWPPATPTRRMPTAGGR